MIGGGVFVGYYAHIEYMPSFDLKSSITITAAVAGTALIVIVLLSMMIVFPGLLWVTFWQGRKSTMLKFWSDEETHKRAKRLLEWFFIPVAVFDSVIIMFLFWGNLWGRWLIASILFLLYIPVLWIRIQQKVPQGERLKEMGAVLGAGFISGILLFLPLIFILQSIQLVSPKDQITIALLLVLIVLLANLFVISFSEIINPFILSVVVGVVCFLYAGFFTGSLHVIPKKVMELYKFGNIATESLLLKKEGCQILKRLGMKVSDEKSGLCVAKDMLILSRLGKESYLQAPDSRRFPITSSNIQSWTLKKKYPKPSDSTQKSTTGE